MLAQLNECVWRSTAGGGGDLTVASAITGYYTPAQCANPSAIDGAVYAYRAESDDLSQFESGEAPYDAGTATLKRSDSSAKIYQSSNSGSAVTFSAAPKVRFSAAAQSISSEELLGYVDFAVDGAASVVTLDVDLREFLYLFAIVDSVRLDISSLDDADYVSVQYQIYDISNAPLLSAEASTTAYFAERSGGIVTERVANERASILWNGSGINVLDDVWGVSLTDNTPSSWFSDRGTVGSASFEATPSEAVTLKLESLFYDDSAGDYGTPPNMTSGKIWFYGRRK